MKNQVEKVIWITMFWILISVFQFLIGYSTLTQLDCDLADMNTSTFLIGSIITGISAGLLGGSFVVFYWQSWLRTMSYGKSLIHIFWTYTLIYMVVAFISGVYFNAAQMGLSILQPELIFIVFARLVAVENLQNYIFWMLIVIATLIALLVNDKYGPGVFLSFLLGKYFHPKREERIFMFLDLRGSTSIAEKLTEDRYFNFLKDAYKDATPAILNAKGEIYQYVGDEIVVSWKKESGSTNANSLRCFYDIRRCFSEKESYYRDKYDGLIPEFKAGLHYGFVMAGEIGIVKRDIAYSGDVLNTTSRIQAKCNDLKVNILISKYLLDSMESIPDIFKPTEVGKIMLRGKQESLMLYTL
jgi:adenylate cyclase